MSRFELFEAVGIETRAPLVVESAHHIAVAINQNGRLGGIFQARGDQNRTRAATRIVQHLGVEPKSMVVLQ
jgi:hypothetical protein